MDNTLNDTLEENNLTLLEFDNVILGFPHIQVLTIESLSQINALRSTDKSSGTLSYDAAELPVYTLNHELKLMDQAATDNRLCIAIKHPDENQYFALMCDAVNKYIVEDGLNIVAMPPLMQNPDSPVTGLVKKNNTLVLKTSAESMRSYINSQEDAVNV